LALTSERAFLLLGSISTFGTWVVINGQREEEKRVRLVKLNDRYRNKTSSAARDLEEFEKKALTLQVETPNGKEKAAVELKRFNPAMTALKGFYEQLMIYGQSNALSTRDLYLGEFPGTSKVQRFVETGQTFEELNYYANSNRTAPYEPSELFGWFEREYLPLRYETKQLRESYRQNGSFLNRYLIECLVFWKVVCFTPYRTERQIELADVDEKTMNVVKVAIEGGHAIASKTYPELSLQPHGLFLPNRGGYLSNRPPPRNPVTGHLAEYFVEKKNGKTYIKICLSSISPIGKEKVNLFLTEIQNRLPKKS